MFSEKRASTLHGVLLIVLFSCSAFYIAEIPFVQQLSFSPLIVGIILGMLYANSLRNHLHLLAGQMELSILLLIIFKIICLLRRRM